MGHSVFPASATGSCTNSLLMLMGERASWNGTVGPQGGQGLEQHRTLCEEPLPTPAFNLGGQVGGRGPRRLCPAHLKGASRLWETRTSLRVCLSCWVGESGVGRPAPKPASSEQGWEVHGQEGRVARWSVLAQDFQLSKPGWTGGAGWEESILVWEGRGPRCFSRLVLALFP